MKVAVVTPTIASKHLKQCIDSVNKQTYKDITHYIFVDGCQYEPEARKILRQSPMLVKVGMAIVFMLPVLF